MNHTTTDAAEARAREVLARAMASKHWGGLVREGKDDNWGVIKPSEAIRAMIAFATAEAASGAGEREVVGRDAAAWVNSIKGVRPADQFIALDRRLFEDCITRALSSCLPADLDGWKLIPTGDPVPLNECPPGPFEFEGSLGFRSGYSTMLDAPRRHQVDAYTFESGEYFWGGTSKTEARGKLIVQPLALGERRRRAAA